LDPDTTNQVGQVDPVNPQAPADVPVAGGTGAGPAPMPGPVTEPATEPSVPVAEGPVAGSAVAPMEQPVGEQPVGKSEDQGGVPPAAPTTPGM
jgi:hypothetical protein